MQGRTEEPCKGKNGTTKLQCAEMMMHMQLRDRLGQEMYVEGLMITNRK